MPLLGAVCTVQSMADNPYTSPLERVFPADNRPYGMGLFVEASLDPVSYTHLTLPTIYSV